MAMVQHSIGQSRNMDNNFVVSKNMDYCNISNNDNFAERIPADNKVQQENIASELHNHKPRY